MSPPHSPYQAILKKGLTSDEAALMHIYEALSGCVDPDLFELSEEVGADVSAVVDSSCSDQTGVSPNSRISLKTKRDIANVIPRPVDHVLIGDSFGSNFRSNNHIGSWNILANNAPIKLDSSVLHAISSIYLTLVNLPRDICDEFPISITVENLGHMLRTAVYSALLAEKVGVSSVVAAKSGFLHDMGKFSSVIDHVVRKARRLHPIERKIIELHPKVGGLLLGRMFELGHFLISDEEREDALNTAVTHHLRIDGDGGYPGGVSFNEKGRISEIVSVCDAFDAMTANRKYQSGVSELAAIEELKRCCWLAWDKSICCKDSPELQFDMDLVLAFIDLNVKPVFY